VDADEEPPHPPSMEAIESAFLIAKMLGSSAVDEVHVMRKIVIDGSNTSGFQRTAVISLGGALAVDGGFVGVQMITVEEDSSRVLREGAESREYALDRLGVPLVEIALDHVVGVPSTSRPLLSLSAGRCALRAGWREAKAPYARTSTSLSWADR